MLVISSCRTNILNFFFPWVAVSMSYPVILEENAFIRLEIVLQVYCFKIQESIFVSTLVVYACGLWQ